MITRSTIHFLAHSFDGDVSDLVGKSISFKKQIGVFETKWNSPYGYLPAETPFPSPCVEAVHNSNGYFVRFKDSKTGNSAIIRFNSLEEIADVKDSNSLWAFLQTQYGKLLFINLLSSPGTVAPAVLEAAQGETTPIVTVVKQAADGVT